jgi:L-ascorbate metabolism protein UlaG (beta-lactamase superfamily)
MLNKQEPYKKIIAIAVTHRHSDHFDSSIMANVANVHSAALLIGGKQTQSLTTAAVQKKFLPIADSITIKVNTGLLIHLRLIPHTYPARHAAVENYRVEVVWNGFRIVHLGDADELKASTASLKHKPDVIVVPSWFLSNDGVKLLAEIIPVKVLVTHISPSDTSVFKNEKLASEIIPFRKYGDRIKI